MSDEFFVVGNIYTLERSGSAFKLVHIDNNSDEPLTYRCVKDDGSLDFSFTCKKSEDLFKKKKTKET